MVKYYEHHRLKIMLKHKTVLTARKMLKKSHATLIAGIDVLMGNLIQLLADVGSAVADPDRRHAQHLAKASESQANSRLESTLTPQWSIGCLPR